MNTKHFLAALLIAVFAACAPDSPKEKEGDPEGPEIPENPEIPEDPEIPDNPEEPQKLQLDTLKIGDFYDEGIVYAVDEDFVHLVSMDEVTCSWAQESVSTIKVGTEANSADGYENTVMFKERADMDKFEAAAWCIYKGDDWYLPSRTELSQVTNGLKLNNTATVDSLNQVIVANGGDAFKASSYYWSSCEHATDATKAWSVRLADKGHSSFAKKGSRPVRAVRRLSLKEAPAADDGDDPVSGEPGDYEVFLLIGQSNMAGRGALIEGDDQPFDDNVYLLNAIGVPELATNPLNRYSSIKKDVAQGINPGFSFSKKIARQTGKKVLLVVNARGGSALYEWKPNSSTGYYTSTVSRAKKAQKYGKIVAILWHQGESNSGNPDGYLTGLKTVVDALRTDLKIPDAPFIAGEIAEWHSNASKFNPVIQQISTVISNSDWVSSKDCGWLKDESDPHFSRDGQILLGNRYAEKVISYCYTEQ